MTKMLDKKLRGNIKENLMKMVNQLKKNYKKIHTYFK